MVAQPNVLPSGLQQNVPDRAGPRNPGCGVPANHDRRGLVPVGNSFLYRFA